MPGEILEAEALREQVRQAITRLSPIEADILRKRFGLDEALKKFEGGIRSRGQVLEHSEVLG